MKLIPLASQIFNTANAINRAKAAELQQNCGDCDPCVGGRPDQCAMFSKATPKGRWDTPSDISPAVVKIPLRAEVHDMLKAAKLYEEHADLLNNSAEAHEHYAKSNREQAAKLEQLARDAKTQAENLERMANL